MSEIWKNKSLENLSIEYNGVVYEEEWKNIPNEPTSFFISSFGRIKKTFFKKGRSRGDRKHGISYQFEKVLAQQKNKKGYLVCDLCYVGKEKRSSPVHILVAESFLGKRPKGFDQVNHMFGVKTDNFYKHIEWSNNSHNIKHAWATGLFKPNLPKETLFSRSKILVHKEIGIFCNIIEAARIVGVTRERMGQMISGKLFNNTKFIAA